MIVWGFDVSSWQSQGSMLNNNHWELSDLNRFPLDEMREHGCRFGIVKYSMQLSKDATAADHTRIIQSADMQHGGYHWCDGIGNYPLQRSLFRSQIIELKPYIKACDVEQHWADWDDKSKRLSEDQIVDNFLYIFNGIQDLPGVSAEYTAPWFVRGYIPSRYNDLNICDGWFAGYTMTRNYVQNNFGSYRLKSWDQFHELIEYIHGNWKEYYDDRDAYHMVIPPGFNYKDCKVIQIDSKSILPNAPYNIDLNLFTGTEEEYEEWLGIGEVEPSPQPPENWEEAIEELRKEIDDLDKFCGSIEENVRDLIKWKEMPLNE